MYLLTSCTHACACCSPLTGPTSWPTSSTLPGLTTECPSTPHHWSSLFRKWGRCTGTAQFPWWCTAGEVEVCSTQYKYTIRSVFHFDGQNYCIHIIIRMQFNTPDWVTCILDHYWHSNCKGLIIRLNPADFTQGDRKLEIKFQCGEDWRVPTVLY